MNRPFRVLFVCFGNAIRSQMAEAFARTYGSDVMEARSAGVYPAMMLAPLTRKVLRDKNIDLGDVLPKSVADYQGESFDLVVNMSGMSLPPEVNAPVREWTVTDPMGEKEQVYRDAADQIESRVMQLILELRRLRDQWRREFDTGPPGRSQ